MRKWICIFGMVAATTALEGANREPHVISPFEVTKETLEDFFTGKLPHAVLECPQGAILPFYLSVKGEFLALDTTSTPLPLEILKSCFIKCDAGQFLFSTDLQEWRDVHSFFTGMIGLSLTTNEDGPTICLNVELNQRKEP